MMNESERLHNEPQVIYCPELEFFCLKNQAPSRMQKHSGRREKMTSKEIRFDRG